LKVFAISDLHLSGSDPKPMDVFGERWENHWVRIQQDWRAKVEPEDLVLVAGDISWAMQLEQAQVDLEELGALPGQKVLLRGNHDYWWSSLTKVERILPKGTFALQNNALRFEGVVVAGTRGWTIPASIGTHSQDEKIYAREVQRMELSLSAAKKLQQEGDRLLVMTHYPPFNERQEPSPVTDRIEAAGADAVVYGHLHGAGIRDAFQGNLRGVRYYLTSCDAMNFQLLAL